MLLPTAGRARVLGHDIVSKTAAVRPLIGLVIGGDRGLYGRLTARQNLAYWAALYRMAPAEGRQRAQALLARVGLDGRADDRVQSFSRGMRQRLHLARGLINDPQVLFLDEPSTGMDPVAAREFHAVRLPDLLPLLFLTPNFVPRPLLTRRMEIAATCNPVTYIIEALRSFILDASNWAVIGRGFAVVLLAGALMVFLNGPDDPHVRLTRRRHERGPRRSPLWETVTSPGGQPARLHLEVRRSVEQTADQEWRFLSCGRP